MLVRGRATLPPAGAAMAPASVAVKRPRDDGRGTGAPDTSEHREHSFKRHRGGGDGGGDRGSGGHGGIHPMRAGWRGRTGVQLLPSKPSARRVAATIAIADTSALFEVPALGSARATTDFKHVESDQHRLSQRQKRIDMGKNTLGYVNYVRAVPKHKRRRSDPQTPDIHMIASKRQFDGIVKAWRRRLHDWDPKGDGKDGRASKEDAERAMEMEAQQSERGATRWLASVRERNAHLDSCGELTLHTTCFQPRQHQSPLPSLSPATRPAERPSTKLPSTAPHGSSTEPSNMYVKYRCLYTCSATTPCHAWRAAGGSARPLPPRASLRAPSKPTGEPYTHQNGCFRACFFSRGARTTPSSERMCVRGLRAQTSARPKKKNWAQDFACACRARAPPPTTAAPQRVRPAPRARSHDAPRPRLGGTCARGGVGVGDETRARWGRGGRVCRSSRRRPRRALGRGAAACQP